MAEPVVSVEGLVKRYGGLRQSMASPSRCGRGRSSLFSVRMVRERRLTVEILGCTRQPTAGSVKVLGHSVAESHGANEIKKRIGMLPQEFGTLGRLTVAENLELLRQDV